MKKTIKMVLLLLALLTFLVMTIEPTDGIVVHDSEGKSYSWQGADYVTSVSVELNDTIVDKATDEPQYWFDTSLLGFEVSENNYTVTLDFDVRSNELTDLLTAPSLSSTKANTFNADYSFFGNNMTTDNVNTAINDLNDIPLIVKHGDVSLSKVEPITVDKSYQATVDLIDAYAGTRIAKFKLGRNSFEWTVTTQQNWEDNTLSSDNIGVVDGRLELIVDWWDSNWDYRVPITLNMSGDNTTFRPPENFQYYIQIDNANDLGGGLEQEDGGDFRFLENNDNGILDYWIENITGDVFDIYVRREENQMEDNEIICYFGNAGATDFENGENTFLVFDEFESLDLAKWTIDGGADVTHDASYDILYHNGTDAGPAFNTGLYSDYIVSRPCILEFDIAIANQNYSIFGFKDDDAHIDGAADWSTGEGVNTRDGGGVADDQMAWQNPWTQPIVQAYQENTVSGWDRYVIYALSQDGGAFDNSGDNGAINDNHTDHNEALRNHDDTFRVAFSNGTEDHWYDNLYVRKFIWSPPTYTFGAVTAGGGSTTDGQWDSVTWNLGVYSFVDNLVLFASTDIIDEWDLTDNLTTPLGLTYDTTSDFWYILESTDDKLYLFNPTFTNVGESSLSHSGTSTTGVNYGTNGAVEMFLIENSGNSGIDNYNEFRVYQNSIDLSGELTLLTDIEYMENDDTLFVLSGDNNDTMIVYDSTGSYNGMMIDLGLDLTGVFPAGAHYDNQYWYVCEGINDVIHQYDNDFVYVDSYRSVGAETSVPADIHSDTENLFVLGAGGTVTQFDMDNTLDNIYVMILVDNDNDSVMDENTGWLLLDENGWLITPDVSPGYNYRVSFRIEADGVNASPRIGAFRLDVDYQRDWISVENWSDNFTVVPYSWYSVENWLDEFRVTGEGVIPLTDLNDLMNDVLIPLLILFAPAIAMANKMGEIGFIAGMGLGTLIVYVAFDFPLGIVLFLMVIIALIFMKGDQ